MRRSSVLAALLACGALAACGGATAPRTPALSAGDRLAAARLVIADTNATTRPGASDANVLRDRMRRYVAPERIDARVAANVRALRAPGGDVPFPRLDSLTVGRWEGDEWRGATATVVFTGYETISRRGMRHEALPLQLFEVRMRRQDGHWLLVDSLQRWLTPEGPMGVSGARSIGPLPERIVLPNPLPQGR